MPRTRDIKPSFFKNEDLAECEPLARLLFAGLWTIADREGRLEDRPKKIKIDLLPYDECDIDSLLKQLVNHGFIQRYSVGNNNYIEILTFSKNQRIHPKEASSNIPCQSDIQNRGLSRQEIEEPRLNNYETASNRTIPSSPSFPSSPTKNQPTVDIVASDESASCIFTNGVELLVNAGSSDKAARSFLGVNIKKYGKESVNDAVMMAIGANPVEPKAYLVKILQGGEVSKPRVYEKPMSEAERRTMRACM